MTVAIIKFLPETSVFFYKYCHFVLAVIATVCAYKRTSKSNM